MIEIINAYTARRSKDTLQLESYNLPSLKREQVLIEITHCGVCHSDVQFIDNAWGDSEFPLVPGHEIVGNVAAIGDDVKGVAIGQRVGASWQQGSCMDCHWCHQGEEGLCKNLSAVCHDKLGGFADFIVVDFRFVFALPENIASAHAAPLLCAGATVYHALSTYAHNLEKTNVAHDDHCAHGNECTEEKYIYSNRSQNVCGEFLQTSRQFFDGESLGGARVGILGLGGLGHLAVQYAKAMGAHVTVFSHQADNEQAAKILGADDFCLNTDLNWAGSRSGSLDFILSTISADVDYQPYIDVLAPKGKLCFVGIPEKSVSISVFSLIIGQKSITGMPLGNRKTISEMLDFSSAHDIKPVIELMPMSEVNDALARVRAGKARYRIVLEK